MKKYNNLNKALIDNFIQNKTVEEYTNILNTNSEYDNRQKCRLCGKDIFYNNVSFSGVCSDKIRIKGGTSHLSLKNINGKIYYISVCEACMRRMFPELKYKNLSRIYNIPTKYAQYAFDVPDEEMHTKLRELCVRSKESFNAKYGIGEGQIRWENYLEKQRITNTFEYKHEKYGMSLEKYNEYNKSRACTLENFVKRYGNEEGTKRWHDYCYREAYTNSLNYYIDKYGNEGETKWNAMVKSKHTNGYSKISQGLFNELMKYDILANHEIYFRDYNREFEIIDNLNGRIYYLDFYDKTVNLCVEFNGNAFHPKETEYSEDDMFSNPFMKTPKRAGDIRKIEKERNDYLRNYLGMEVIIVWEDEYRKTPKEIIKRIINTIKEK